MSGKTKMTMNKLISVQVFPLVYKAFNPPSHTQLTPFKEKLKYKAVQDFNKHTNKSVLTTGICSSH